MRHIQLRRLLPCGLLLLAACTETSVPAEVELTIDGKKYDYRTARAELDQQERGGRYSVYLQRDADQSGPYINLRTYSGNPVARFWVRYTKSTEPGAELDEYVCFVPGTLSDGRETLGWTKDDGKARPRQETGERDCQATVNREGDRLQVTFSAQLGRKNADDAAEVEASARDRITVRGRAVVELGK